MKCIWKALGATAWLVAAIMPASQAADLPMVQLRDTDNPWTLEIVADGNRVSDVVVTQAVHDVDDVIVPHSLAAPSSTSIQESRDGAERERMTFRLDRGLLVQLPDGHYLQRFQIKGLRRQQDGLPYQNQLDLYFRVRNGVVERTSITEYSRHANATDTVVDAWGDEIEFTRGRGLEDAGAASRKPAGFDRQLVSGASLPANSGAPAEDE